jgi:hypothetical protein
LGATLCLQCPPLLRSWFGPRFWRESLRGHRWIHGDAHLCKVGGRVVGGFGVLVLLSLVEVVPISLLLHHMFRQLLALVLLGLVLLLGGWRLELKF